MKENPSHLEIPRKVQYFYVSKDIVPYFLKNEDRVKILA
jgi:hypothetical protein